MQYRKIKFRAATIKCLNIVILKTKRKQTTFQRRKCFEENYIYRHTHFRDDYKTCCKYIQSRTMVLIRIEKKIKENKEKIARFFS